MRRCQVAIQRSAGKHGGQRRAAIGQTKSRPPLPPPHPTPLPPPSRTSQWGFAIGRRWPLNARDTRPDKSRHDQTGPDTARLGFLFAHSSALRATVTFFFCFVFFNRARSLFGRPVSLPWVNRLDPDRMLLGEWITTGTASIPRFLLRRHPFRWNLPSVARSQRSKNHIVDTEMRKQPRWGTNESFGQPCFPFEDFFFCKSHLLCWGTDYCFFFFPRGQKGEKGVSGPRPAMATFGGDCVCAGAYLPSARSRRPLRTQNQHAPHPCLSRQSAAVFFFVFFVFFFNGARPTTVRRDRLTRPDRFHQRPVSIRTDDVVINMETKKKSRSCPAKNRRKILSDSLLVSGWVPLVIYEFSINCCDTRKDGNALPYSSIVKLGKSQ